MDGQNGGGMARKAVGERAVGTDMQVACRERVSVACLCA